MNSLDDNEINKTDGYFAKTIKSHKKEAKYLFTAAKNKYYNIDIDLIKDKLFSDMRRMVRHEITKNS